MYSPYDFSIDNTNFGSSSSITFPVLQRTAEEKILNSDRLTLERWEGERLHMPEPQPMSKVTRVTSAPLMAAVSGGFGLLGLVCVCVFWRELCPMEKISVSVFVMNISIEQSSKAGRFLTWASSSCDSWRKTWVWDHICWNFSVVTTQLPCSFHVTSKSLWGKGFRQFWKYFCCVVRLIF